MAKATKTNTNQTTDTPSAAAPALRDPAMPVASSLAAPGAAFRRDLQRMARDLAKLGYLVKTTANGAAGYWPAHIARPHSALIAPCGCPARPVALAPACNRVRRTKRRCVILST